MGLLINERSSSATGSVVIRAATWLRLPIAICRFQEELILVASLRIIGNRNWQSQSEGKAPRVILSLARLTLYSALEVNDLIKKRWAASSLHINEVLADLSAGLTIVMRFRTVESGICAVTSLATIASRFFARTFLCFGYYVVGFGCEATTAVR